MGQKQKTEREKENPNYGNNNGQLRIAKPPGPIWSPKLVVRSYFYEVPNIEKMGRLGMTFRKLQINLTRNKTNRNSKNL